METVRTFLGPAGGWFAKDMVVGKVPLVLGCSVVNADISDHRVNLKLRGKDGSERTLSVEHVIAATGYKVDLNRLAFLEPGPSREDPNRERIAGAFLQF